MNETSNRALPRTRRPGSVEPLNCHYFDAGSCRSCALLATPYETQLADKVARCGALLATVPQSAWLPPFSGGDRGFRNRAKLVVGGSRAAITLGILGPDGQGVDLRECAIQAPGIAAVIPTLAAFIESTGLAPYEVPARRGELKFVHVTLAPSGALMLRFVTRTEHGLNVLRSRCARLRELIPNAAVISVNLLPEHKAVLEGEREELLHGSALAMELDRVTLYLRPQSFFQTNTAVAAELYAQVAEWVSAIDPTSVWDLYCGVGGFALHVTAPGRAVLGVEISEAAVESARRSAAESAPRAEAEAAEAGGTGGADFVAADATAFAVASAPSDVPEVVIVNPPRRGLGPVLAEWLETSGVPWVVYSSCNPESLARDLAAMPAFAVRSGRVFDMFPHTNHLEVAVLLERQIAD